MIGLYGAVLGVHGGAFHDGQNIALHAFAGYIGTAVAAGASGHLVDLVDEHDAVLLGAGHGFGVYRVHVDHVLLFFGQQYAARLAHFNLAQLGTLGHDGAQHVAHVQVGAGYLSLGRGLFHLDLHDLMLQLAAAQPVAYAVNAYRQLVAVLGRELGLLGSVAQQDVDGIDLFLLLFGAGDQVSQLVFNGVLRFHADAGDVLLLHKADGGLDQVADDGLDVAAHIADLGELGGLDLYKGRVHQFCQAAGDLGLAHAGGADHEDVLGGHFIADIVGQHGAAVTVAQGNGHGALCTVLTDDETVQFADYLAGGKHQHSAHLLKPFPR